MTDTITDALEILNSSIDDTGYKSSPEIKKEKRSIAQILALIAIAQELETANQIKEKELKKLYGDDFL